MPRIRGFICTNAHPIGCAAHVSQQIEVAKAAASSVAKPTTPYRVLVLGSSTGYGLAGRIAATYLYGAMTLGVFYERAGEGAKTASAGWYNTAAFDAQARQDGHTAYHINGDAFSDTIKEEVIARIRESMGQVDCVIYSLASGRRTDPETDVVYSSALKPIGETFTGKTIDLNKETVADVTIPPASEEEIDGTIKVMGGDDLRRWVKALLAADVLASGARVIPLSYIGPLVTQPIYRHGTIGRAKEDLEQTTTELNQMLAGIHGGAVVSVNKAVVTQASAAIPVVPLYYSVLTHVLKENGNHEEPIHQMVRLFATQIGPGASPTLWDDEGRLRLDNYEMEPTVQAEVERRWTLLSDETLPKLADFADYKRGFRQLFGFEVEGVDYAAPTEVEVSIAGLSQ